MPPRRRPETCVRMPVCVCVCVCVLRRAARVSSDAQLLPDEGRTPASSNGPQSTRTDHRHCQWHQMCLAQGLGALAVNAAANELFLIFYEVGETSSSGTHLTVRVV